MSAATGPVQAAPVAASADPLKPLAKLFRDLRTSPGGLSAREAARRLEVYGPNELARRGGRRWPGELARQFTHPLAMLLMLAAVLAWVSGSPSLGVAIAAVIVLNAAFAFAQEMEAERAVEALAAFLPASVAAFFAILFTGRYPRGIFEFNVGVLRWTWRVQYYAIGAFGTDRYPPFRLDLGGHEPGSTLTLAPHQHSQGPGMETGPGGPPARYGSGPDGPPRAPVWTTGPVISMVIGTVLALCSLGLLGAGGVAVWADTAQRSGGYVDLGTASYATSGRALASDTIRVHGGWGWLRPLIGQIRIRATVPGQAGGVFAGVAPASAASRYLSGVAYTTVTGYSGHGQQISHPGSGVPRPPGSTPIWAVQASGSRAATLLWMVRTGDWAVIIMNADRSPGVSVRAHLGASLPALGWLATEFLAGGTVLALIALACIIIPVRMATSASADNPAARS